MSPRGGPSATSSTVTTRSATAPYSRRPVGQPKSSRQQFSACGACRMRRVRCDLKDLPIASAGPHPACSNCKERGLKCVDEFADVKAVKLLRRGRRLQQVEAIYGKMAESDDGSSPSSSPPAARLPRIIPHLQTEFFASSFWRWFNMQHPLLDSNDFPTRFFAHAKGTHTLGPEGGLLAMLLVVWATSFGFDEKGMPDNESLDERPSTSASISSRNSRRASVHAHESSGDGGRKRRREKTDAMIREILELIDYHGIMRRPTWDGVCVLLLILPLIEEAHPLERMAMHDAALSQSQALCTFAASSSPTINGLSSASDDALIRARIFWHAYIQEGISTGIKGSRLVLDQEDFESFQRTIPECDFGLNGSRLHSPTAHSFPPGQLSTLSSHQLLHSSSQRGSPVQSPLHISHLFAIPIHISTVCRKVHAVLTGPSATRRIEDTGLVDAHAMRDIWDELDRCWEDFDAIRQTNTDEGAFGVEQFVSGWLIFIFECHNLIRESLKQLMAHPSSGSSSQNFYPPASPPRPSSHSSSSSPDVPAQHLHAIASQKCYGLLPCVLAIIKFHLSQASVNSGAPGLFEWDAGLVRDGCFFTGYLAASMDGDILDFSGSDHDFKRENSDGSRGHFSAEEGVGLCLAALGEMKWAFSKSEGREETVRMIWESRKARRQSQYQGHNGPRRQFPVEYRHSAPDYSTALDRGRPLPHQLPFRDGIHSMLPMTDIGSRPHLPPLNLMNSPRRVGSAPSTACTMDGHGANGWPSYTPPGTGTSIATSATDLSARGSPVFAGLPGQASFVKGDTDETYYHVPSDIDQFSFHAPVAGPLVSDVSGLTAVSVYHHRASPGHSHSMHPDTTPPYLDAGAFTSNSSSVMGHSHVSDDINACPQFGDNCNAFYH